MKTPFLLGAVALMLAGCGRKDTAAAKSTTNAPAASSVIAAPVEYLGAINEAKKHSVKVVDLVQVEQAIRQFQAAEDRFPKSLDELIQEKYLVALPKLPNGMEYRYNPADGDLKAVRIP